MAITIAKSQAKAISEAFFGTGVSEEKVSDYFLRTPVGLVPKNAYGKLIEMAGFLIEEAQNNLNKAGKTSTGGLSSSLKIINPQVRNGVLMQVDVEANDYYKFVDGGVSGTKGGSGEFSFKNNFVGSKMLNAIRRWIVKEKIRGRADNKYRGISKREDFRKKLYSENTNSMSLAWAMAKSIKMKGLKPTNFMRNAITATGREVKSEMGKAFKIDIIRSLPKKF